MCLESIFKLFIFHILKFNSVRSRDSLVTFSVKAKACDLVHTGIKVIYRVKVRWRFQVLSK